MFSARTDGPGNLDYFANDPKDVEIIITQQEDESKNSGKPKFLLEF